LLLGRGDDLVPGGSPAEFRPGRWRTAAPRPGAWLPFGAGPHACPGRNLGIAMLGDLAAWAGRHDLTLTRQVGYDQSRGIVPTSCLFTRGKAVT
jgi:cytochrome P450